MKALTLVILGLVVCSSAYLIKVPTTNIPTNPSIAPLGWVRIQKMMLPLFDNVCEASTNAVVVQLAQDFTLDAPNGDYRKSDVIENLRNLKSTKGLLPKGEIFTEYNPDHVHELKALYELFYYAGSFDTFYKAASWARQNVNCGLFVDAIYLAIVNRKDTEKISVPAPYELLPNYYINKDIIVKASLLLTGDENPPSDIRVEGNAFVLDANYTSQLDETDEDAKLAYFREDIGLNAFYFIRKLRNAPWFNLPNDVNSLYGERMYQMMKQFAARYDLERYSHGMSELEGFSWESAVSAYDPMLIYSDGHEFEHRSFSGVVGDSQEVTFLRTIENNLGTVVTHLRQAGHNKSQILSHLMEILVTAERSYETLCRKLLGFDKASTERHYSVLEHYMTTMRDPMFWKINKKMVQLIDSALKVLPSYARNELYFPGVEVLNIETKKMMTSLEHFQFDVTDALKSASSNTTFQVKISQPRLNHKPFTMKLNISSLVTKKGIVKIYIGPKMMPGELALKKHLFVLLDLFEINLKKGINVVSRASDEMASFSGDFMSLRTLRKKVEDAEFGLDALTFKTVDSQIGYPSRLVLPKGLPGGLPLQVFVFVAPFIKGSPAGNSIANMELNTAVLSPGYPLDLAIDIRQLFSLPNSLVKEITVTYKSETPASGRPSTGGNFSPGGRPGPGGRTGPNDWNSDAFYENGDDFNDVDVKEISFDDSMLVHGLLGVRPDFTYKKTDTTNYAANKNQYRNREDYSAKRTNRPFYPKVNSEVKKEEFEKEPLQVVIDPNTSEQMSLVHKLLGDRPDFAYRGKETTDYTGGNTEYRKKEYHGSGKTYKSYNTQTNIDANDMPYMGPNQYVVEDDDSYVDTLLPHRLFNDYDVQNQYDTDHTTKKNEYAKKREEYAAKGKQKKEDYDTKREYKKEYYSNKREQKKDLNAARKEKNEKIIYDKNYFDGKKVKNGTENLSKDDEYDESRGESSFNTDTINPNYLYNIADSLYEDTLQLHNLLGSKPNFTYKTKGTTVDFLANQYQYKKKKEEFDDGVTIYKKKEYREKDITKKISENSSDEIGKKKEIPYDRDNVYIEADGNSKMVHKNIVDEKQNQKFMYEGPSVKKDVRKNKDTVAVTQKTGGDAITHNQIIKKVSDNSSDELSKQKEFDYNKDSIYIEVDDNNKMVHKNIADKKQNKDFMYEGPSLNKDVRKNKDTVSVVQREDDDVTPNFESYEGKTIHKNISDDKWNKNVLLDKNTSTNKYISKFINNVPIADNKRTGEFVVDKMEKDHKTSDKTDFDFNETYHIKKDITNDIYVTTPIDSNVVEDESEEMTYFPTLEPTIAATEKPKTKKRVSVYDFLFNPVEYDEEEIKVYE